MVSVTSMHGSVLELGPFVIRRAGCFSAMMRFSRGPHRLALRRTF